MILSVTCPLRLMRRSGAELSRWCSCGSGASECGCTAPLGAVAGSLEVAEPGWEVLLAPLQR